MTNRKRVGGQNLLDLSVLCASAVNMYFVFGLLPAFQLLV
jgi:hypothetical protein